MPRRVNVKIVGNVEAAVRKPKKSKKPKRPIQTKKKSKKPKRPIQTKKKTKKEKIKSKPKSKPKIKRIIKDKDKKEEKKEERKKEYEIRRLNYENDPLMYDLGVSKILWTLANQNPKICHNVVNSDYIHTRTSSLGRPATDATLFLAISNDLACEKVNRLFGVLQSQNVNRCAVKRSLAASWPFNFHSLEGFAAGALISWSDEENKGSDIEEKISTTRKNKDKNKNKKSKSQKEKTKKTYDSSCAKHLEPEEINNENVSWQIEVLCAAVSKRGLGSKLLRSVEEYVKNKYPHINAMHVNAVRVPLTIAFYEKHGFLYFYPEDRQTVFTEEGDLWLYKKIR